MPVEWRSQIKDAVVGIAALAEPSGHHNVRAMTGEWADCFRLRTGADRTIFRLVDINGEPVLQVLHVGPRGDVSSKYPVNGSAPTREAV